MIRFSTAMIATLLSMAHLPLSAQDLWMVELRGNAAVPIRELAGADLETGVVLEGTVAYRFLPHFSAYTGWDWVHFSTPELRTIPDVDVVETGYVLGLRYEQPFGREGGPAFVVRLGGTWDHIEVEDEGGVIADSGHGLGWEVGPAFLIPIWGGWRVSPGMRYRALSRDLTIAGTRVDANLGYITGDLGLSRTF